MISATVTWSHVVSPPCSWESLLGEGSVRVNDQIPLLIIGMFIGAVILCVDLQFSNSCSS